MSQQVPLVEVLRAPLPDSDGLRAIQDRIRVEPHPRGVSLGTHAVQELLATLRIRLAMATASGIDAGGTSELVAALEASVPTAIVDVFHYRDAGHLYSVYLLNGQVLGGIVLPRQGGTPHH